MEYQGLDSGAIWATNAFSCTKMSRAEFCDSSKHMFKFNFVSVYSSRTRGTLVECSFRLAPSDQRSLSCNKCQLPVKYVALHRLFTFVLLTFVGLNIFLWRFGVKRFVSWWFVDSGVRSCEHLNEFCTGIWVTAGFNDCLNWLVAHIVNI